MISIIICSRKKIIDPELEQNIAQTIGVPYEIIWMDNSKQEFSICSAYNQGASKSKYGYLCFMHDDIFIRTANWGSIVIENLQEKNVGVIGVAGATLKSRSASPWWISNFYDARKYWRCHFTHRQGADGKMKEEFINPENEIQSPVVVLDGLWLCCRKAIWEESPFDEKTLPGFHFYDMDFSLAVFFKNYQNGVLYTICIEHHSSGSLDKDWLIMAKRFYKKWKDRLPVAIGNIPDAEEKELEFQAIKNYLLICSQNQFPNFGDRLQYWFQSLSKKPFQKEHLRLLKAVFKNG